MSNDFLWSEASQDVQAERAALERSKALVALAEVRGFLVKASSEQEYDDRLSLMRQDVNRVLAATDLSVHEEVLASLRADFEVVLAAPQKTAAAPGFDGHVTSENATVGQQVSVLGGSSVSSASATVVEVGQGSVKVEQSGRTFEVLDYGWEDGNSYLHTAGKEAATKTASGEWGESEWSDEGASRVETVPGREGYLVADVYPSEFETGVWVWSIKPSYPLSEYPEVYDLGHAANMDEAKAAADTAMGGAIQSYSRG